MIRRITLTCPQTGEKADTLMPGPSDDEQHGDRYRSVQCPACGWFHAVHVETGRVLGLADDEW